MGVSGMLCNVYIARARRRMRSRSALWVLFGLWCMKSREGRNLNTPEEQKFYCRKSWWKEWNEKLRIHFQKRIEIRMWNKSFENFIVWMMTMELYSLPYLWARLWRNRNCLDFRRPFLITSFAKEHKCQGELTDWKF